MAEILREILREEADVMTGWRRKMDGQYADTTCILEKAMGRRWEGDGQSRSGV